MNRSAHHDLNRTVLYFTPPGKAEASLRYPHLRGSKLKSKDENKIYQLRTKHVDRYNLWYQSRQFNNESSSSITEKKKPSLENIKHRSLMRSPIINKIVQAMQQQRKEENSDIILSSRSNQYGKQISRQIPQFSSENLEGKMNEYLNILIRKSEEDQQEKLKKMLETQYENKKNSTQNTFIRKMKILARKKKSDKQEPEESEINVQANETIRLLKERRYEAKEHNKLPSFFSK